MGAHRAGLHVAVHAIGDQANDFILDVFHQANEQFQNNDSRFRIEHAQHLSAAALEKIPKEKVIPSMQPYHAIDDGRWASKRLDSMRLKRTYAFKSLLQKGAALTFGSDWTVAPLNPIEGIYAAVTRSTLDGKHPEGWYPEEKITVEEALRCYTSNNAFAGYQEDRLGILKKGMLADFVVLSEDIFQIDPLQIKRIKVERTVVNGKEVFIRSSGNAK
jgi:predicted amidohydrolase YtcJ